MLDNVGIYTLTLGCAFVSDETLHNHSKNEIIWTLIIHLFECSNIFLFGKKILRIEFI